MSISVLFDEVSDFKYLSLWVNSFETDIKVSKVNQEDPIQIEFQKQTKKKALDQPSERSLNVPAGNQVKNPDRL